MHDFKLKCAYLVCSNENWRKFLYVKREDPYNTG